MKVKEGDVSSQENLEPAFRGILPGKSHGQRSLEGCSPWGPKELETTLQLNNIISKLCTAYRQ